MSAASRTLLASGAVCLWSTNAWAAGVALSTMDVGWLLLVQYATAASVLITVRLARRETATTPRVRLTDAKALVGIVGLGGTIFLQYLAFATAPIVAANVLAYAWPLLTALWVAATVRSRRAVGLAGLATIGFGGVALIFGGTGSTSAGTATDLGSVGWGYAAALGSAACMAFYTLAAGRLHAAATDLLVPATLAGVLAAAALTAALGSPWPTPTGLLAAAYIGLGPMAAGYGLWTVAMSGGDVERLAPLGLATPLLSTILLLMTGAQATATTLTGVGIVLGCGIAVLASSTSTPSKRHHHTTVGSTLETDGWHHGRPGP